jgi:GTP-binding protein
MARLKRAAKQTPLALSAASGEGVQEALRALLAIISQARAEEAEAHSAVEEEGWKP